MREAGRGGRPTEDVFVRIAHWTAALGFFVAYVPEDVISLHVWAGYVGVLLASHVHRENLTRAMITGDKHPLNEGGHQ